MIVGVNAYAARLYFADQLDTYALPGMEWCSGHGEHSLFLVMFAVLANTAVPRACKLPRKLFLARTVLKGFLIAAALAMLVSISIDAASFPTLSDLKIENLRAGIVEASAPGVSIEPNAVPRTTSETRGFIAKTLATTTLALIGLIVVVAPRHPRRMLGVALTVPGVTWLLSISVGTDHRLSPFVFGAISESLDPLVVCLWLSTCAMAAGRLARSFDQGHSPSQDSSVLLELSSFIAASYTLYERQVMQSVFSGETSLANVALSLSIVFVDMAALVVTLTSIRNLAARLLGMSVRSPTSGEMGIVVVLFWQLVVIGPLCILSGSVYWIVRVG